MKQVCMLCDRTAFDQNLYCQEVYCPAEMSPMVLGYGKWLGAIEVVRPVVVLRTSVLYEARLQDKKVFIKIAHAGTNNTKRLQREAEFFKQVRLEKVPQRSLPVWRPPHADLPVDEKTNAYGRAVLGDQLLYYYLLEYFEGEPLRELTAKIPQLWINHVGWIMSHLTAAVAYIQSKGRFHFGISPESILVFFPEKSVVPKIQLVDLGIMSDHKTVQANWYPEVALPAYTAPELLNQPFQHAGYATDTYGLGLVLYELLVGQPCYTYKLLSDPNIHAKILANDRIRMNRIEDVQPIAEMAMRSVEPNPQQRFQDAATFAKALQVHFGNEPKPKKKFMPSMQTSLKLVIGLLTLAFIITFIFTLRQLNIF